jgi:predicted transcriptional regulator
MENVEMMFEKASKIKLRFPIKGSISVEDLWDLSPKELDTVYRTVNKELKSLAEDSLLEKKTGGSVLELQVGIIKHIYAAKQEEVAKREKAFARREQIRQLDDIIAQKENTALTEKSLDDLKKMRDELEAGETV